MGRHDLVIAGIAMVTSVGRSYPETCASIRAGLSRPSPLTAFAVLEEATQENVPLVGHPLQGITEGFFGPGLWVRLARLCFAELMARSVVGPGTDTNFWSRTAILALTPDPNGERFSSDEPFEADYVRRQLLEVLVDQMELPVGNDALFTIGGGGATVFRALVQAQAPLRSGRFDRIIVLSVDSLLDDITLEWLAAHGRLKGPDAPSGVAPGEAAVALVVERAGLAGPSDPQTHVSIASMGFSAPGGKAPAIAGEPGRRLADVVRNALKAAGFPSPFSGTVTSDLNGEVWKAMEYGRLRMELLRELDPDIEWTLPCSSVGDVGCAMGALSIACGSWNVLRGSTRGMPALVMGLDPDGEGGAFCLAASEP